MQSVEILKEELNELQRGYNLRYLRWLALVVLVVVGSVLLAFLSIWFTPVVLRKVLHPATVVLFFAVVCLVGLYLLRHLEFVWRGKWKVKREKVYTALANSERFNLLQEQSRHEEIIKTISTEAEDRAERMFSSWLRDESAKVEAFASRKDKRSKKDSLH